MKTFLSGPILLFVLVMLSPDLAAFCKWTDKDGTVHYVEDCPGNRDTTAVEIDPQPSQEEIENSRRLSEQMRHKSRSAGAQRDHEKQWQQAETTATRNMSAAMSQQCAGARWQLETLKEQRPVYMDENGMFHSNQSAHNAWYQGARQYLDDQRRATEIQRFEQIEAQTCNADEAEIRDMVRSYVTRQNQEICRQLKVQLADMQRAASGQPSAAISNLDGVIRTRCR